MNLFSNPSYLLPPLLGAFVVILLLVLVWQKGRRDFSSRILCCLLLSVGLWALFVFGMRSSPDTHQAVLWARLIVPAAYAIFVFYYHFSLAYTGTRGQRGILLVSYLFLVIAAGLISTRWLVERMVLEDYGYAPIMGTVGLPIVIGAMLLVGVGTYNLLRRYKASHSYEERNRLLYLVMASLLPLLGGVLDAFSDLPPAAIWANLIFCIICSIAILKYHLLDIRIIVRKSLVYLLVSTMVAVPYVGVLLLVTQILKARIESWWVHAFIILLLAGLLRPLYGWAQQLVDRLFYRDRYDYLKALEQFSREAQSVVNLKELSSTMTQLVSGALRATSTCLLLASESDGGLRMVHSTGLDNLPSPIALSNNSPLVKWLKAHPYILSSEELNIVPQLQSLSLREKNDLKRMEAELFSPIKTNQGQLSGILILGQKLSQQPYSNEDRQLLTAVSNQMAMALENARLYEQTRKAEEVLRESEDRFRQFFDNEPNYCYMISPDAMILNVNKAALRVLGYDKEELVGKPLQTIYATESIPKMKQCFEKWKITGALKDEEFTIITKDRNRRSVLLSTDVVKDGEGEVLYSVSVQKDITERKQAEDALRESEEKYRSLVNDVKLGIFRSTPEPAGRFLEVNPAIEEITGYSREELLQMNVSDLYMHPKEREAVLEEIASATGKTTKVLRFRKKDRTEIVVSVTKVAVRDDTGKVTYFDAIMEDITERKRANAERKEMEQKAQLASRLATVGEMAAGIAHEINNPLTGVIGFAQLLIQQDVSEDIKRQLAVINDGAQRVSGIVKRLLTFARQQKPKRAYVNINDIVATTLDLRAYTMKTGNIHVTSHLDPELPRTMADSGQLQQVFLNIILNAETEMKSAHGRGNLLAKTEMIDDSIRISFEDDGPGITKENMERIFNPFFTTREISQGTGLGLSVCHGIIAAHGGKIYCKSELGKGATLTVELPVVVEDKQWERPQPSKDESEIIASARILVVDDEPSAQQLLAELLADAGHKVDVVGNANDALEKITSERYSLILLDIKMPGMNGIELYTYIQKIYGALAERVIFVTGNVAEEETKEFLSKSSAPYIVKPFDATQLRKDITRILIERGV